MAATAAENIDSAITSLSLKLAEVMANPLVSYSVDGVSLDYGAYYRMLTDQLKALREMQLLLLGPIQSVSAAR